VSEKRSELRIPLMARVDVLWEDEDGAPPVAPATLDDKSAGGVSVRMKVPIGDGSKITIRRGSEQFSGSVTNCGREKGDYVVGVKRDAGERRDRE
jgi:hypothetical protein